MKNLLLLFVFASLPFLGFCREDSTAIHSIQGITNEMLHIISVEQGEEPDWDAFRNLFLPKAQMMALTEGPNGQQNFSSMNLEEFIRYVGPNYARNGFEEYSLGHTIEEFNGIATVFQSFYCKTLDGAYENRGVNTYQLVFLQDRWWIAAALFTNEDSENKLPERYIGE